MNFSSLLYRIKSPIFAGIRRVFLALTFLLTPIQLSKFLVWKLSNSKSDSSTNFISPATFNREMISEQKRKMKVAIILHVFYPDIGIEILQQVLTQSKYFDKILITHCMQPDELVTFRSEIPSELSKKCDFMFVKNRYRDSGPFMQAAGSTYLSDCGVFLKLHTKRSPHLPNELGSVWRRNLIVDLLNPQIIKLIVSSLLDKKEPTWSCPDNWLGSKSQWGFNSFQVWNLCEALGINYRGPQSFPVGNMYWLNRGMLIEFGKMSVHQKILPNLQLNFLLDGSSAHAHERLVSQYPIIYPRNRAIKK